MSDIRISNYSRKIAGSVKVIRFDGKGQLGYSGFHIHYPASLWSVEFVCTPRFNKNGSRDPWGSWFSLAVAGGISGEGMYVAADKNAAFPMKVKGEAADLIALLHCLGYPPPPETEIRDNFDRPIPLSRGKLIQAIF